ncbi:MAG: Na+/H+ antiporter NhaA [Gammaproteobacteria bacterium]|nr:MAG: Na+/H+ antiporter NhaA [Gammaproteobacteria bacterium]
MDTLIHAMKDFLRMESAGGILLMLAAVLAMVLANSPLAPVYHGLLHLPVEVRVGNLEIAKPFLLWINDGLMAIFFFLVGLELKRELLEGELAGPGQIVLPLFAAAGGMLVPALVYLLFNHEDPVSRAGWAIPTATDIAFALGVLALLGSKVPNALKVFLVSLAIFDDLGAIVIIAMFYTADLSMTGLAVALVCLVPLFILNRRKVVETPPYLLLGAVMWVALLKSGVHATLAGVAVALFIPLRNPQQPEHSPLRELEHGLHTAVAFGILPLFAFANAGIPLGDNGLASFLHTVPLGIALGLLVGKPIGVLGASWLCLRLGMATLPMGMTWPRLAGVGMLCGIGFTMSLFIGSLAFNTGGTSLPFDERTGIVAGSLISALAGYFCLRHALRDAR